MGEKSLLRPNGHARYRCSLRVAPREAVRWTVPSSLCSLLLSAFKSQLNVFFLGKSSLVQASKVYFQSPTQLFESLPPTSPQDIVVMRRHPSKQALCTSKQKLVPTVCPFKRTIKMPFCTLLFPRAHTLSILRRGGAYL